MSKRFRFNISAILTIIIFLSLIPVRGYASTEETVAKKLGNRGFKNSVDLGVAASDVSIKTSIIAKENGRDVVYTTADGGKFNVVDLKDNKLLFAAQLGDVSQVWTHSLAPDGTVYIGGLAAGNAGELWSYKPEGRVIKKLGIIHEGEQVWSSAIDDQGNVYLGTFPSGKIVKYEPSTGKFIDLGQVDTENSYVRSMAYADGYIYAGLGTIGKVYRINVDTLEKENITKNIPELLGKDQKDIKFAYDMAVVGDYLFVRIDDGNLNAIIFYDLETQTWLDKKLAKIGDGSADDFGTFGFSNQIAVKDNKAYVIWSREVTEINLDTFETRLTGIKYAAGFRGAAFVELTEGKASLVTVKRNGTMLVADVDTGASSELPCVMEANPLTLHNLAAGNDGNLYMTTYPGGPKGSKYNTKTGTYTTYTQGQAEGIVAGNGNDLYFGVYPGAIIQKMDTSNLAIETLFNLKDEYSQDRPYIMKFENNKLLIGTIPDYGKLGGTLTIYDPATGARETYKNVVQDQSIVGLAYKDGKIYGSTTIRGGLDIVPTAEEAKMFVWDVEGKSKITEFSLNIPGVETPTLISGLTFHDGLLWGAVDGIIFAMNPDTYQVVKYKNIYPEIVDRGMWRPVHILFGEDGLLYTDVAGKLTVMKTDTLDHVTLIGSGPEVDFIALAKDSKGNENIYYIDASPTTLKMIPVIEGGVLEEPPAEEKEIEVPIYNNSFEQPLRGNAIPGWSSLFSNITANVSFGISSDRSKTGESSLRIVDKAQNETVFVQSDYIPVVPGVEYTASADLFLEDGSVSFFLRYFGKDGKQVGKDQDGVNIIHIRSGHKDWQKVRAVVKAPEGATYARLFAGASNYFTTSAAYFDDFKLSYKGFSPAPASPGTLYLSAPENVYEGEEFSVAINYFASEAKDLKGINTSVAFDDTKLQLIDVEKVGAMNEEGAVLDYDLSSGTVNITATAALDKVISENGEIVNLRFKALENLGETNVSMSKNSALIKANSSEGYLLGMERQLKMNILEAYAAIVEIGAKVTYDRGPVEDNEYTFILKNEQGEVIDTKGNIGESITFNPLSFKQEGLYTFTLTQQPMSNNKIKIDRSTYTINVNVTRVREGYEAEVTYERNGKEYVGTPVFKNTKDNRAKSVIRNIIFFLSQFMKSWY